MKLRITSVDHNGYNGRDFHPADSDIGLVVSVLKAEAHYNDGSGGPDEPVLGADGRVYIPALAALARSAAEDARADDGVYWVFETVTADGRQLTLIDHEVEVAR